MDNNYIFPAEWELQECIQLTWPHADTDWKPYLDDINRMFVEMAAAITERERLIIATPHPDEVLDMLREKLTEKSIANVTIAKCD